MAQRNVRWRRETRNPDRAKALEYALDIRKFEIDLYWERAKYFWAFLTVALGAYWALYQQLEPDDPVQRAFLVGVASFGFLVAVAWYLVNRGSKFWQENWEGHVDGLEGYTIGYLYRKTLDDEQFRWRDLDKPYRYSVSRINQIISIFTVGVWGALFVLAAVSRETGRDLACHVPAVMGATTILFTYWLVTARGGEEPKRKYVVRPRPPGY